MKELSQLSDNDRKAVKEMCRILSTSNPSKDALVHIIELCGDLAELKTIPDYAKHHKLSYNGVKKHRQVVELMGVKFVIN